MRLRSSLLAAGVVLPLAFLSPMEGAEQESLRILARYPIPVEKSTLADIRWASDDSVLVLTAFHGVAELGLEEGRLEVLRRPVPNFDTLGGFPAFKGRSMSQLAVSQQHILVSSAGGHMAVRKRDRRPDGTVLFKRVATGGAEDIDAAGGRLLFLGAPSPQSPYTDGGVAWLGSLGSEPGQWRPLLRTPDAPEAKAYFGCTTLSIGAVRFLPDGTFLVVPGFQPGAYLFDPQGKLIRSWTHQEIGLDTDCSGMSKELVFDLKGVLETRLSWLNQRRVLDDILPLPQGPGLLVRSVGEDGKIHWDLRVLHAGGGITTFPLPLEGTRPYDRLRGDVRAGRIALLLSSGFVHSRDPKDFPGELIVAELALPRGERTR